MKKALIIAMMLLFAFSSASFARSNWGIGVANALSNILALEMGGFSQATAGTLFYHFNNQHSIEGGVGVYREAEEGGDTTDMTALGIKYLFNFFTSRNLNVHVGIEGIWGQRRYEDGDSNTYTDIVLLFGGETFINENLSLLLDLTAQSGANESEPTSSSDNNVTSINIWPSISFRLYMQ